MSTPIPSLGNKTPEQLRVAELREELKKRGINIKGLKKDLVERLDEILRQEAVEAEADESKKSSPEQVIDEKEEETPVAAVEVVEVATQLEEEDDALKVVELVPSESLPGDDGTPGTTETVLSLQMPDEDESSSKVKESETDRSHASATVVEPVWEDESVGIQPLRIATAESVADEHLRAEPESAPEVAVMDEDNTLEGEAKVESEDIGDVKLVEAENQIVSDSLMETEDAKYREVELQDEAEQLKPGHRSRPASSTDAVIIEAAEAEGTRTENAALSEGLRSTAFGGTDVEEEESIVEETGGERVETSTVETMTVETVSVVTETTVVTTETLIVNEIGADLSTAEGDGEDSFNQRNSDARTLSVEDKVDEEATGEQTRDKDEEGIEVDQDPKAKDPKSMEIDSDSLTGVKRKDGEESRHQEPAKRQRRWNSEKSIGAGADVAAPRVLITDTFKEAPLTEGGRADNLAPVAPSPTTTASSTPKASATSTSLDKPAPSRPALLRTDILLNGDADKKRVVPPPSRNPSASLKIDRFVRPFTIKAVRELLEQTGTVKEMWMDQIKTHCYVTYSSVEEAVAARNALYGLQWPVAGGKLLIAEFVEPEEVKSRVDGINDKPAPTPVTTPRGSANSSTQVVGSVGLAPPAAHVLTNSLPPPPPLPLPPRERPALPPKKEPEPPIPTLDDLFKKTRTKPQIYFLPLTEEQVADKRRNKQPASKAPVKA